MSKGIISLMRLASNEQVTIYLIEQQSKSRKFFDYLHAIGEFEPNLDHLILKTVALDDGTDKTFALYAAIINRHSNMLKPDFRSIHRQAKKAYNDLVPLKKKLSKKSSL